MQTGNKSRIKELKTLYSDLKGDIDSRLEEFRSKGRASARDIFAELCFCILTPQSRAISADKAIKILVDNGKLFTGSAFDIRRYLTGVRFYNNKASYIVETRSRFTESGRLNVKNFLKENDVLKLRQQLMHKVKGYGLKEASHFLRNTGRGCSIAILDRHILKELAAYGIIDGVPASLTPSRYYDIEGRMAVFAAECRIPLDALDFVLWYRETGYLFK